jgi:RES domain-containing protein
MLLYRISKSKYALDLSGEGARRAGGRWNYKGIPVVYTADSTALATLETLVHFSLNLIPKNLAIATIDLPDELPITTIDLADLPDNWATYPAPVELAQIGNDWVQKQETVAFCVPSSIIPNSEGRNYILNPAHPDFVKVRIIRIDDYRFDNRLFEK